MTRDLTAARPPGRAPAPTGTGTMHRRVTVVDGGVRFLAWTSADGLRSETARIVTTPRGLRASGTVLTLGDRPCSTSYALLCDATGRTRRLSVRAESASLERAVALTRAPGAPWLDGTGRPPPHSGLDDVIDIELSSSVLTASLLIRRLGLHRPDAPAEPLHLTVARIATPHLEVGTMWRRIRVIDHADDRGVLSIDGPDGSSRITVDDDGFAVDVDPQDTGTGNPDGVSNAE
ncbi:putative glycolipid-binding domain-containing protein [Nakamurella flava]|nr:putative glycolipid-binding domain-containing protein [Nakamurella flava]